MYTFFATRPTPPPESEPGLAFARPFLDMHCLISSGWCMCTKMCILEGNSISLAGLELGLHPQNPGEFFSFVQQTYALLHVVDWYLASLGQPYNTLHSLSRKPRPHACCYDSLGLPLKVPLCAMLPRGGNHFHGAISISPCICDLTT